MTPGKFRLSPRICWRRCSLKAWRSAAESDFFIMRIDAHVKCIAVSRTEAMSLASLSTMGELLSQRLRTASGMYIVKSVRQWSV